ncbi:MAG: Holliday junction resolvase-like protein [Candidatus Parvarchaeum sp.]
MEYAFFWGLVTGLITISIISFFVLKYLLKKKIDQWEKYEMQKALEKTVNLQRPILKGRISEQLFPVLYQKEGDLSDLRFLGNPVDYIKFEGLSNLSETGKVKIKFIEIKTGNAKLNKNEEAVKKAVEDKEVYWEEITI